MMVGTVGFEPTAPWSQTRCATRLRHAPNVGWMTGFEPATTGITIQGSTNWATSTITCFDSMYQATKNGAPDRIRTCDHPLRRRMLYPTELQAHDLWYRNIIESLPWRIGRSSRIRTYDPLVPNQVRYQAAPCSELGWMMGLEPTTTGITIRGSTNWATSAIRDGFTD